MCLLELRSSFSKTFPGAGCCFSRALRVLRLQGQYKLVAISVEVVGPGRLIAPEVSAVTLEELQGDGNSSPFDGQRVRVDDAMVNHVNIGGVAFGAGCLVDC